MRGRPRLYTSYEADSAILNTTTKRVMAAIAVVVVAIALFGNLPGFSFMGTSVWHLVLVQVLIYAIAAIGLNILTGVAGQVSLGHAFFMGIGAYTGAVLGSEGSDAVWGLELPIWIWLPASGLVAALAGILVSPTAVRLRGLYLAIVTLGLVFLGEHLFRNLQFIAGPPGVGRSFPNLEVRLWKEEEPLLDLASGGSISELVDNVPVLGAVSRWVDGRNIPLFRDIVDTILDLELTTLQVQFFFVFILLILGMLAAKNLIRSRIGRALQAVRDRDIAAEVMGVPEAKSKLIAFALSSAYAGVAGALLGSVIGSLNPEFWSLALSIELIAIILIGGAGTITGTVLGATFVVASERLIEDFTITVERTASGNGPIAGLADLIVSRDTDFGLISLQPVGAGLSIFQFNQLFYGLLIVLFLIFEPDGLYGLWVKVRNYWKGWPFSY